MIGLSAAVNLARKQPFHRLKASVLKTMAVAADNSISSAANSTEGDAAPASPTAAAAAGTESPASPSLQAKLSGFKTAKGVRDISLQQAWRRRKVIQVIRGCFEGHGVPELDTPVFELRELLTGKYGEEAKLIYNLEDQGGELLSLRYDLTVPFARHLCQNKILKMKRYHIGKVYRRDNPSFTKGRFREFYQCDVDFAGEYETMLADSECLHMLCKILTAIKLPYSFLIKINHRGILNGLFAFAGVPEEKFKPICSSVDKLDKMPWEDVRKEMINDKGLDPRVADKIGAFVSKSGDESIIDELLESDLGKEEQSKKGLEELKILYELARSKEIDKHIKFDLSLARGLDYYTGLIFETVIVGDVEVGSVAAGGRYDTLVESLLPNHHVPCVGLSVGIERLFAILESQPASDEPLSEAQVHCCLASIGKGTYFKRDKIVADLIEKGIRVDNFMKKEVRPLDLYHKCERDNVPYAIFFGPKDLEKNQVCVRNMSTREEEKITIDQLADTMQAKLKLKCE